MTSYEKLHSHMKYHQIKKWFLRGAIREDANTIRRAVEKIPEHRLIRKLAKILAKEGD